ncbi:hypothetical protein V5799_027476 [Amblyomma americanum]|uniref:Uncharacterized protein n=1 Tax=Amblyomma americanum TaxID=6943 RepID=A0AAQ4DFL7_AMBAM
MTSTSRREVMLSDCYITVTLRAFSVAAPPRCHVVNHVVRSSCRRRGVVADHLVRHVVGHVNKFRSASCSYRVTPG